MKSKLVNSLLVTAISFGFVFASTVSHADVTINKTRTFTVNSATVTKVDDQVVDATQFQQETDGMVTLVVVGDDADAKVTSGTAQEVDAENQIKGPVTSLSPFQVLGQDVVVDADTVLVNTSGTFSQGEQLEVSGYFNSSNVLQATRVESNANLSEWKLISHVSAVGSGSLGFGLLNVDVTGVTMTGCAAGGPIVGDLVKFEATPATGFDIANALTGVTSFKCKTGPIELPEGETATSLGYELEGFVTTVTDANNFAVNGQAVQINSATKFSDGTLLDLLVGVRVEVEGNLDVASGLVVANEINFNQIRVRITGPVAVADLTAEQVTVLGLTGVISALTEDEQGLATTGLSVDSQVEVHGVVDSLGNIAVSEIKNIGAADPTQVRLRGPVSNVTATGWDILGVHIDATGATFFADDTPIQSSAFFASLVNGAEVDVDGGSYDSASKTITGGNITMEDAPGSSVKTFKRPSSAQAGGLGAIGLGTLTSFSAPSTGTTPPTPTPTPAPAPASSGGGGSIGFVTFILLMGVMARRRKFILRN